MYTCIYCFLLKMSGACYSVSSATQTKTFSRVINIMKTRICQIRFSLKLLLMNSHKELDKNATRSLFVKKKEKKWQIRWVIVGSLYSMCPGRDEAGLLSAAHSVWSHGEVGAGGVVPWECPSAHTVPASHCWLNYSQRRWSGILLCIIPQLAPAGEIIFNHRNLQTLSLFAFDSPT